MPPAGPSGETVRRTTNLATPISRFVGREAEVAEVQQLLGHTRLLTLTGTGGIGKTRLALEAARGLQWAYPDGVWLVELGALTDPALVPQAVATALGVREEPTQPVTDTLAQVLGARHLLLLLDNCEHLIAACAELADTLLQAAPGLQLLATSREALGLTGETWYRVPALAFPADRGRAETTALSAYDAVQLFVERARAVQPAFAVTDDNAHAVCEICRRLDGIPLALELAAARVRVLSVEQIATRLHDRFRLLTGGSRAAPTRQQTLRAALDWSHDLLSGPEQVVFRRLAVFAGGCTLEAAEAVGAGAEVSAAAVLDLLTGLVDKSLVLVDQRDETVRYRLLETVRQYGWDKLVEAGDAEAVHQRHAACFLALALQAEPMLRGAEAAAWAARLEQDHDNLRGALRWLLGQGQADQALRLGGALGQFWHLGFRWTEGRAWLMEALDRGGDAPAAVRARALRWASALAENQSDYSSATRLAHESLALYRDVGDKPGIAAALNGLGIIASNQGNYRRAVELFEECLALERELGLDSGRATGNLGYVAWHQAEYERTNALLSEYLDIVKRREDSWGIAFALTNLGIVAQYQGEDERAIAPLSEALAHSRKLGEKWSIGMTLNHLGRVAQRQGHYGTASAMCSEGLAMFEELGDRSGIADCLGALAAIASAHGWPERAARLLGAAEAVRVAIGAPMAHADRADHERTVAAVHAALDEAVFSMAWEAGRSLSLEQAIAEALAANALPNDM